MKSIAYWAFWFYAFIYNLYGTWVLGPRLAHIWIAIGRPRSVADLRTEAMLLGPIISLIALVCVPIIWHTKNERLKLNTTSQAG